MPCGVQAFSGHESGGEASPHKWIVTAFSEDRFGKRKAVWTAPPIRGHGFSALQPGGKRANPPSPHSSTFRCGTDDSLQCFREGPVRRANGCPPAGMPEWAKSSRIDVAFGLPKSIEEEETLRSSRNRNQTPRHSKSCRLRG